MTQPTEVEHGFELYAHRGLTLVDGEGCHVVGEDGTRYLDAGGASYGTANVGHGHPRVQEAIAEASLGLAHAHQTFAHPARSRLVERLLDLAGSWARRVFLSNSGTEAVEAAIKAAVRHTGRSRLVAFERGFHGRTLGSLAATHDPEYRKPFQARLGETTFVPYGDEKALEDALGSDVAAVLVEPVQGEGGPRVPPEGFLDAVVQRARDHGALSVVDEVQTGLGRTGTPLAIHAADVEPDLVCLAKSLAAGLPLGATVAHERVQAPGRGVHGTTFGGSPVACSAANAVLDVLEDESLAERAADVGSRLRERLDGLGHPLVRGVRGRGLMLGVDVQVRATPVLRALQSRGVLALPGGSGGVRMLPPLVLEPGEADRIAQAFEASLDAVQDRYARGSGG